MINQQKDLVSKIKSAADVIHRKSIKASANFIITSNIFYKYFNRVQIRKDKIKRIFNE